MNPDANKLPHNTQSMKHDIAVKKHNTVNTILFHKSIMRIECPYCTQQKCLLEQQDKTMHTNVKDKLCAECKLTFPQKTHLVNHR